MAERKITVTVDELDAVDALTPDLAAAVPNVRIVTRPAG